MEIHRHAHGYAAVSFESLTWHTGMCPLFHMFVDALPHISKVDQFNGYLDGWMRKIVDNVEDLLKKCVGDRSNRSVREQWNNYSCSSYIVKREKGIL